MKKRRMIERFLLPWSVFHDVQSDFFNDISSSVLTKSQG